MKWLQQFQWTIKVQVALMSRSFAPGFSSWSYRLISFLEFPNLIDKTNIKAGFWSFYSFWMNESRQWWWRTATPCLVVLISDSRFKAQGAIIRDSCSGRIWTLQGAENPLCGTYLHKAKFLNNPLLLTRPCYVVIAVFCVSEDGFVFVTCILYFCIYTKQRF